MKRLVIIVEGDSEKEFVEKTLRPFFATKGVYYISCYKIRKTNGGLKNYENLKTDLVSAINETNVLVTTLIDYYALPKDFPGYNQSLQIADKDQRLSYLEKSILLDISKGGYLPQLYPYIQLHEFEAFLFSDLKGFELNFSEDEANLKAISGIIDSYPNPEDINNSPTTAPSKRLKELIPSYNKVVYGNIVIESNGIESIIKCCPRFKKWILTLVELL